MKITLGGSAWLHETMQKWREEQADSKLDLDQQRKGDNEVTAPPRDTASPFERMYAKGQLDPDGGINEILHGVGLRYYSDWYLSGLQGLASIDYGRVGGGGVESGAGMPTSERQADRRLKWRNARIALGDRYAAIVDPIVLEEKPIHAIRALTGYSDKDAASAVTKERLNTGLRRLAVHYGVMRTAS